MILPGERRMKVLNKKWAIAAITLSILPLMIFSYVTQPSVNASPELVGAEQTGLLKFIRTVQVTPDSHFLTGCFARINYVPATDRFVVSFGTKASTEYQNQGAGFVYKEYTVDMQETGKTGILEWLPNSTESGDMGSCMVNNTYYCAFMSQPDEPYGWRLVKFDAVNWTRLNEISVSIQSPNEGNSDPMVAYVNGQLDVSDQYNPTGIQPLGNSSLHRFYTADLQLIGMRELHDTANVVGASMMFVDGVYYFVTANNFTGDLVLMKYDVNWKYLGMKYLMPQAHWSTGMTYDGTYFYLAYLNTSQRTPVTFFPVYPNVHLAVFDRDWNLQYDETITNFTLASDHKAGRPWVMLHGNRLYVSYDVDSVNKTAEASDPSVDPEEHKWQAYVSVYEIAPPLPSTDLNKDGTVNIVDISIVARAFGSTPLSPNWNFIADLDQNGVINIIDVTKVAKDFGKTVIVAIG
jgi:hypothetical protein